MRFNVRVQVLSELALYGDEEMIADSLLPLGLLTNLRVLRLGLSEDSLERELYLSLRVLEPLAALQQLCCSGFRRVELRGSAVLPQLVSLAFLAVDRIDIDAALSRLQCLQFDYAPRVRLLQHLALPKHAATDLAAEHIDWLCGIPTITRLSFCSRVVQKRAVHRRVQVMKRVLSADCILEQPVRE
ncbi:hypothetical protein N2152v2_009649 [Parachlorella kessleri]